MAVKQKTKKLSDPCMCCKKTWNINTESDMFVVYEDRTVCLSHHGVKKDYKEYLSKQK